jgi:hypothetical protein
MHLNLGIILALLGLGLLLFTGQARRRLRRQKPPPSPGLYRRLQLASFVAYGLIIAGLLLWGQ